MKFLKSAILPLAAIALLASSCNEDIEPAKGRSGSLRLSSLGVEVNNAENVVSRAVTDVSGYIVDLYAAGEETPQQSWTYADMPGVISLVPGDYSVKVRSHNVEKAAWEAPYFCGESETFTITDGKITEPGVVKCSFASLKVSVKFGERLRARMGSDVKVTVRANDDGRLDYSPSETRAGYFAVIDGSLTLTATISGTINGRDEVQSKTYTDVKAGQHRIITFECGNDVPTPDAPSGSVDNGGISIDVTYVDVDLTGAVDPGEEDVIDNPGDEPGKLPEIPGEEDPNDPIDPVDPVIPDEPTFGFTGNIENGKTYLNTYFYSEGNPSGPKATFSLSCPEGVAKADVNIDSNKLTPSELEGVGLCADFDLCNPVDNNGNDISEILAGFGFPVTSGILNHTSADFDVTAFMPLLAMLGTSDSTFTIKVTDNTGAVQTISFTIHCN